MFSPYKILIAISILVVLSYLFNLVSSKLKIPSVILLLLTGIISQFVVKQSGVFVPETRFMLELLGVMGLIFIVLEGSLDLKISSSKLPLIGKSFLSALLIFIVTTGAITYLFTDLLSMSLRTAMVYATPLGVISSAIAIPSVHKLSEEKREFITYESTFSDIIGIMFFNYIILDEITSTESVATFFLNMVIIILVSFVSTAALLMLLNYSRAHAKFYLVFAILILVYSISKIFHLPSLLFILIFGLMLNNAHLFIKGRLANYLHPEKLNSVTGELKLITIETAFIIRTFFFLLFGYSIDLILLNNSNVIMIGSIIIVIVLLTRFVFLRFISRSNTIPEIFIAPRGLITIVLFYSIPTHFKTEAFNEGILLFVIIASSIIMMLGLMFTKTTYQEDDLLDT